MQRYFEYGEDKVFQYDISADGKTLNGQGIAPYKKYVDGGAIYVWALDLPCNIFPPTLLQASKYVDICDAIEKDVFAVLGLDYGVRYDSKTGNVVKVKPAAKVKAKVKSKKK